MTDTQKAAARAIVESRRNNPEEWAAHMASYRHSVETQVQILVSGAIQNHWMSPDEASQHAGRISDIVAAATYALMARRMPIDGPAPEMSHTEWSNLRSAIIGAITKGTPDPFA